jgi:hypothetical protein
MPGSEFTPNFGMNVRYRTDGLAHFLYQHADKPC